MRRTAFALLLLAPPLVALLLLTAACSQDVATHSTRPVRLQQAAAAVAPGFELVDPAMLPGSGRPDRNVFTYREKPAAVTPVHHDQPVTVTFVQPPSDGAGRTKTQETPRFPYRCIGRFGPENAQLVAFVIDGEVKLARAGEVLADKYLVRGIGIESVEVGLLSAPDVSWRLEFGK
jgi:hypothetical protein